MKKMKELAVLVAAATTLSVACAGETPAPAELTEEDQSLPLSASVSLDVLSDYLWRGQICNDNPVWQPAATVSFDAGDYGSLSANVWSSFDLTHKRGTATDSRRSAGLQEIDYTLSYAVELWGVGLDVGHIWYTNPNANGPSDQELYATVSYENPIVTPSASVYWNYSDSAGNDPDRFYYSFALSHEFSLTDSLSLSPSASLGFGGNAWTDGAGTELSDQTVGLALTYALCENVSFGAQVNYTWIPSHTLRHMDYMGEGKDQLCWGGVNVTFSF